MKAVYTILDGQHRAQAIREVIQNESSKARFEDEQISVDFLLNIELAQAQTYFRLLNDTAKTVSKNLTLLYDDNPLTKQIHKILSGVPLFADKFVEKEKTNLTPKSEKLFVYKWLFTATQKIKPGLGEDVDTQYCTTFWTTLAEIIPQWKQVYSGVMTPSEVRENYICSHGVFIEALGEVGRHLIVNCQENPLKIRDYLTLLRNINWSKTNPDWKNKVVDSEGKMLSRTSNKEFLVKYLMQVIQQEEPEQI